MSVLSRLQAIDVKPCLDTAEISCNIFAPAPETPPVPAALLAQPNPLVSCLMMTRGDTELMKYSLACYRRQTYANRELVVVAEPAAGDKVSAFIAAQGVSNATVIVAPVGSTLGENRNLAAARAQGKILVTWDDDDLHDPRRLVTAVQVLRQTGVAAMFLPRLLIWWPRRKLAAISGRKNVWEGTMAVWRDYMPNYLPLPRGEDTAPNEGLLNTHRVARVDSPLSYVYAVTGRNTWDASHFERFLSWSECVFEGDEFDELNALLADRLPVLDYAAELSLFDAAPATAARR